MTYSVVVSMFQKSLAHILTRPMLPAGASLDMTRTTFFETFGLYRSLETFTSDLEKAITELCSLAGGGVVVRTVVENRLSTAESSAQDLGRKIAYWFSRMEERRNVDDAAVRETTPSAFGLFRYHIPSPRKGMPDMGGTGNFFGELCPSAARQNARLSYEIVYVPIEPTLDYSKLSEGIESTGVKIKELAEHVHKGIVDNIGRQVTRRKVDIRDVEGLAKVLGPDKLVVATMTQMKKQIADSMVQAFTIADLLRQESPISKQEST